MKHHYLLILLLTSFIGFCESGTSTTSSKIPESEYYQLKKIDELETVNKGLEIERDQWNILKNVLNSVTETLEKNKTEIEKLKTDNEKASFIKEFNLYDIVNRITNESGINSEYSSKAKMYLQQLLMDSYKFQVYDISDAKSVVDGFSKRSKSFIEDIKSEITILPTNISDCDKKIKENEDLISEIIEAKESKKSIDKLAIVWGLPAFCITILLLNLLPLFIITKIKTDTEKESDNNKNSLDVSTVLLLTMTILILGLSKMITGEVLGTLLGGISAYVLNRNTSTNQTTTL